MCCAAMYCFDVKHSLLKSDWLRKLFLKIILAAQVTVFPVTHNQSISYKSCCTIKMHPFLGICTFDWLKYDWPRLSDPFWSEFAQSGNKGYNLMFNIYARRKLLNRFKVLNIEIALLMGILNKNISKLQFLN